MEKDNREYRLLVIEDNAGDFLLIEEYLEDYMLQPVVVQAISARNAASIIADTSEKFDIILLDLSLPDKSGEELIRFVLDLADGIPVLVLTGYTDMTFSIKSLSLGADDYLLKDELTSITLYKSIH